MKSKIDEKNCICKNLHYPGGSGSFGELFNVLQTAVESLRIRTTRLEIASIETSLEQLFADFHPQKAGPIYKALN